MAEYSEHHHLYGAKWRRISQHYLVLNPFCVYCEQLGTVELATVVDHKIPHKGDKQLFWDRKNWQGLCKPCHDGPKAKLEASGHLVGNDLQGDPIDPGHPWNTNISEVDFQ